MKKIKSIFKNKYVNLFLSIFMTILSGAVIAIGVNVFISPNGFLSTGFTGVALIVGRIYDRIAGTNIEMQITGVLYLIFNVPVLWLAWKKLSKKFAIFSAINILTTSIVMTFLPENISEILHLSVIKGDINLLDAALFVGAMNGTFNAFAFMVGGSAGGIDILTMYYSLKRQTSIGKATTFMNVIILIAGLVVNGTMDGIKLAFYTLIYVIINSMVIDLFYIRNRRTVLLITTDKGKEIADIITHKYVRGVTILDAKGAFTGQHKDFLYCACSSFEVVEMIKEIKEIDEHSFVSVLEASKIHGNFINKAIK